MDFSLLSQNLIVILSLLTAGSTTYIITKLRQQWLGWSSVHILAWALLAAIGVEMFVSWQLPVDKLPGLFWLMALPFTLSADLVVVAWTSKTRWLKWFALATVICCSLFSLALINGYYRFYPTLYSVFNAEERFGGEEQTTVDYSVSATQKGRSTTIENSLYASGQSTKGRVFSLMIPGTASRFHARPAWVYMPAVANNSSHVNLPVVVLLAGVPGFPGNWLGSGLEGTMDRFAKSHHGITPVIFMVDDTGTLTNDTECVNSSRGNVESYLTTDVPSYIKAHYEVSTNPANWAIGGLSMGGMCSIMLALRHPDVYHYFLDFGGETAPEIGSKAKTIDQLFDGSETAWANHQPLLLLQKHRYTALGGFFADGTNDNPVVRDATVQLYQQSKAAGIESIYEQIGGEHTFSVWQQAYKDALPWLSNRLGATECLSGCVQ